MKKKICPDCKQLLPYDCFSPDTGAANGLRSYCKSCGSKRTQKYYVRRKAENSNYVEERRKWNSDYIARMKKDPAWVEKYRAKYIDYSYKKKYGITLLQKTQMLTNQNNKCLMCKKGMVMDRNCHVDHDHATGMVRGLLCGRCNTGLHYIENTNFLQTAKKYLEDHEIITA